MFRLGMKLAIVGAVGGALATGAVALGGSALAQTNPGSPGGNQQGRGQLQSCIVTNVANATHKTPDQLKQTLQADRRAHKTFDQILQDLGISKTQLADAVKPCLAQLPQDRQNAILNGIQNGQFPGFGGHRNGQDNDNGQGNQNGRSNGWGNRQAMQQLQSCVVTNVANATHKTPDQLKQTLQADRQAHKTFDQILQDLGISKTQLADAVKPCLSQLPQNVQDMILNGIQNGRFPGVGHDGMRNGRPGNGQSRSSNAPSSY